jgi:hypothetical protein
MNKRNTKKYNMKKHTKQKRELKNEVHEILSSYDFGYSPTFEKVDHILNESGIKISEILSNYFLSWDSMKSSREDILVKLENDYDLITKKNIRLFIIQYIKEYYNSDTFKNSISVSDFIEIKDTGY